MWVISKRKTDKYVSVILTKWCASLGKKIKTSFSIDQENLKWIDKQVETKRFRSRSHVMDYAIEQLKTSTPK